MKLSEVVVLLIACTTLSFMAALVGYRLAVLISISRNSSLRRFSLVASRLPEKSHLHIIHKNVAFVTHPDGYSVWRVDKNSVPHLIAMKSKSDTAPNPFMATRYLGWAYIYVRTEGYTSVYRVKNLVDALSGRNAKTLFRNSHEHK